MVSLDIWERHRTRLLVHSARKVLALASALGKTAGVAIGFSLAHFMGRV